MLESSLFCQMYHDLKPERRACIIAIDFLNSPLVPYQQSQNSMRMVFYGRAGSTKPPRTLPVEKMHVYGDKRLLSALTTVLISLHPEKLRKEKDVVKEKPKSKVDLRQRLDYSKRLGDYVVKNIYEKNQDYTFKKKGVEGCHTQASGVLWWLGAPKA
ncbi:uncharacterized protein LOC118421349 [Branchiostoma floridae]|uniref:Uncharacterized protein LOC118421349 n=1 Tax=Branchiostoma floridae TaxID=7739 RepID=A0A9J7LMF9_BRAFL|nr:uncharacterized protein LOC118421349 [Branchiostoma floridae]